MGSQPLQVSLKPSLRTFNDISINGAGLTKSDERLCHFHQVDGVNDADSPPRRDTLDGLGVKEVGVHHGLCVDEPSPHMPRNGVGIHLFSAQQPGGGERAHDLTETDHGVPVG